MSCLLSIEGISLHSEITPLLFIYIGLFEDPTGPLKRFIVSWIVPELSVLESFGLFIINYNK